MENGSDRASNEKFTDDEPANGADASEGVLGTIADVNDKSLVQLEDVNSLLEYKIGMNAPDGTRMRAVGLDGKLR